MKKYFWKGLDKFGKNKKGFNFAHSKEHLMNLLLDQGVAVLSARPEKESIFVALTFSRKIKLEQKVFFFSQLAVLVESGVELLKALKVVCRQIKYKKLKNTVLKVIDDVASGDSLSGALEKQGTIFSSFMVHMIRAGENSGKLGLVLKNLSDYLNDRLTLQKKLKKAALLPAITLTFAFFIIWGVFVFVIPQFENIFASMEKTIPPSTQFVLNVSYFLRSQKALIFLFIFLGLMILAKIFLQQKSIKKLKDKLLLKIYFFRKIILLNDLISFLQVLSMFLKSGISLDKALQHSCKTVKNSYFKRKVFLLTEFVIKGQSLEESLVQIGPKFFPENLVAVVSVGEQLGNLDLMMQKAALVFQEELKNKLYFLATVFQPTLMILLGLLIAFLLLAVYLPIFNMASLV